VPNLDSTRDVVYFLADRWYAVKDTLEITAGIDDMSLHVVGGVVLQVSIAALFRVSLTSILPWLVVLNVQVLNEAADLYWSGLKGDQSLLASTIDTVATILLPTVVLLLARRRPDALKRFGVLPSDQEEVARAERDLRR